MIELAEDSLAEVTGFKDIEGYEGLYAVDCWGNVFSFSKGGLLKQRRLNRGKGYMYVSLWKDNEEKKFYVHRLVAQAFIPNPLGKKTVNHKDGETLCNWVWNLEWMTHQEQQDHAWQTGLTDNSGENCGTSKLTACDVVNIKAEFEAGGTTQRKIAEKYGVTQGQISKIVNDKRWSSR